MHAYHPKAKPIEVLLRRLSDTDDRRILLMVWAIHALQNNRVAQAKGLIRHPVEAETTDIESKYMAYKWEMESIITLTLNMQKDVVPDFMKCPIDTTEFSEFADTMNLLKAVEQEDSKKLAGDTIMREFHRIAHRQFPWQTGWENVANIYRHVFIYGQGQCAEYFKTTYGLTIQDFMACCFCLYVQTQQAAWNMPLTGKLPVEFAEGAMEKTMAMVSSELWTARRESFELYKKTAVGSAIPAAYHPSYLRVRPVIRAAPRNHYIAPFPEFLLLRSTVGLYFDLIAAPTGVMNEARSRFEEYARNTIVAYLPEFEPEGEQTYQYKGNPAKTPDVLLKRVGRIVAVFECKATKLSFQAQYANDPAADAKSQYDQIANGVFQLWKFFSHVRRGIIDHDLADEVAAVVLTMEPWTQTSAELRTAMIAEAEKIAAQKEPEMTVDDKRTPLFVSIHELENVMSRSTGDDLLETFRAAAHEARYDGWSIREVRTAAVEEKRDVKKYPFEPGQLLPWWKDTYDRGVAKREAEAAEEKKE
ncbi:hypothetical protein CEJ86_24495 [Sinorhizobium meliloti]|uniref:Uncharacterized protein n=2 Tax=Rhizobium meliloti TaxID=382 RepID=A0A2J0YWU4_RHIML|nr:hypothetical protein CEJ86_24495 [Sinorhizobium meliloti]